MSTYSQGLKILTSHVLKNILNDIHCQIEIFKRRDKAISKTIFTDTYYNVIQQLNNILFNFMNDTSDNTNIQHILNILNGLPYNCLSTNNMALQADMSTLYNANYIRDKEIVIQYCNIIITDNIDYQCIKDINILYLYFIKILVFVYPNWKLNDMYDAANDFIKLNNENNIAIKNHETINVWVGHFINLKTSKNFDMLTQLLDYLMPYYDFFKSEHNIMTKKEFLKI